MVIRERVLELLRYEPETGKLYWKLRRGGVQPGSEAGSINTTGYRQIMVDGQLYVAHRLVWLICTGSWPTAQLDHLNRSRDDNRFENLREATQTQNLQNQTKRIDNRSGYTGVSRHSTADRWVANIRFEGVKHYLGLFNTLEEAAEAYAAAKAKLHTFHPEVSV